MALVALVMALLGCSGSTHRPGGRDDESKLKSLPACPTLDRPPQSEWVVITNPIDGIVLSAPRTFSPLDRDGIYIHGGAAWKSGEAMLELMYGYWGMESFPSHEKACRTTVDGMPTMYIEHQSAAGVELAAWFITAGHYDPVLSARSTLASDLSMLRSVLGAVRKPAAERSGDSAP